MQLQENNNKRIRSAKYYVQDNSHMGYFAV
jgi:hypothetical protein